MKRKKNPDTNYYQSPWWKGFIKTLWTVEDRCEICGALRWKVGKDGRKTYYKRRFSIHHIHYRTLGHEKRSDVQCLCSRCHDLYHQIHRMKDSSPAIHQLKEVIKEVFRYEN